MGVMSGMIGAISGEEGIGDVGGGTRGGLSSLILFTCSQSGHMIVMLECVVVLTLVESFVIGSTSLLKLLTIVLLSDRVALSPETFPCSDEVVDEMGITVDRFPVVFAFISFSDITLSSLLSGPPSSSSDSVFLSVPVSVSLDSGSMMVSFTYGNCSMSSTSVVALCGSFLVLLKSDTVVLDVISMSD
jgi:hypothetical protein